MASPPQQAAKHVQKSWQFKGRLDLAPHLDLASHIVKAQHKRTQQSSKIKRAVLHLYFRARKTPLSNKFDESMFHNEE
jgi:hypothetical protein